MNLLRNFIIVLLCCVPAWRSLAAQIIVQLPKGTAIQSGEAKPLKMKLVTPGKVDGVTVKFSDLLPDTAYDVKLTLADGTVLQGVNMGWYDAEPAKADAGEINDDDRSQMLAVLKEVLSFYNKNDMVLLNGDHDRATALVQLVRDKAFHSDSGDEVIWHMELWYYKNQHGGWEKVQQANELLRRERFKSRAEYEQTIEHTRWVPELGGLKVAKNGPDLTVTLPADAGVLSSHTVKAAEAK